MHAENEYISMKFSAIILKAARLQMVAYGNGTRKRV